MNRRVLLIAIVALVLAGGMFLWLYQPAEAPVAPATVAKPETAVPRVAPREAPAPSAPAVAGTPSAPRRRTTAPSTEPAPAPPPEVEAAPEVGTLRIEADVPGAQVFIDRQFIGAAPVTAANIKPGTHQLNVSVEGYDGVAQTIDVEPGPRDIMVRFKEVRLNANINVVHKHRMGSCTGRLIATPQGLRYETTDKEDAFSAGLLDLETFQVDYMEKNLKVKPRKGKQYNFTDPDGNADRLFVFHRDVEKARERLKKGDAPGN